MTAAPHDIRAVLFDFDGTLAELTLDFDEMRERAMLVAAPFFDSVPAHNGRPVLEWTADLCRVLGEGHNGNGTSGVNDSDAADDLLQRIHTLVRDMEIEAAGRGRLFANTRPMLAELARRNVATGIVTRNCEPAVLAVFPDAATVCGCLLSRDHVQRVKPHPEHLLAALRLLGVAPEKALMIGDHPMDVTAGKRAGTLTAGVASGHSDIGDLRAVEPDYAATDCEQLMKMIWG